MVFRPLLRLLSTALPAALLVTALSVPGAQAYEEESVSSGGTVNGKVTYSGTVPTRKIIPTKDSEVCGGIRDEKLIKLGPGSGVQDAVVFLENVERGKAWGETEGTPEIDNVKCVFEPHIQVVRPGEIDVVNTDPVLHNTHGFYGRRTAFNLALPNKGQRIKAELSRPGLVRVECDAHGWMLGWIYVADHPYYVLTGDDGSFSLTEVPAGDYKMITWQEHTGVTETPVTVEAGGTLDLAVEIRK